jgi:S1-C subfamily serine protease
MIAAAETASAFLGPLQLLTNHYMEKAAMADRGDLIVAVDDQRVRSSADFNDAMARVHPGDTLYLTVIRPLPGGDHATMKIAVKVGKWQPGNADSCAAMTTASAQPAAPE